jgi:hypothetical protein
MYSLTEIVTHSVVIGFILSLLGTIVLILGQLVLFAGNVSRTYVHVNFSMMIRFIIVLYVLGTIITLFGTGFLIGVCFPSFFSPYDIEINSAISPSS